VVHKAKVAMNSNSVKKKMTKKTCQYDLFGFFPEGVDALGQHFEFVPFGSGRRSCPGASFALRVIHLILARLLQGFDLATPPDKPVDMTEGLGVNLPKATPLEVVLTPKLPSKLYEQLTRN